MVNRIFVEKHKEFASEARGLFNDARGLLGITNLSDVRLFNRYDAEGIDSNLFDYAVNTVFSEPQIDIVYASLDEELKDAYVFAVEYLPGQFDQRADSAAQCIQIISQGERPLIKSARVYALYGNISEDDIKAIKNHVINPVESREASLELPSTLETAYEIPTTVATIVGFIGKSEDELKMMLGEYGFAMDLADLKFCQNYFKEEARDPSITELRMIDTYWSDHCRHTTFNTIIENVSFEDELIQDAYNDYLKTREELGRTKPITLMDIGTIAAKYLKKQGKLDKLDESEEINACTVKIEIEADGVKEPWLLFFKNETHNHPTEIEPFGGAATCIGGAIRDPLSGRSYVYAAMRLTGASDPTVPVSETIPGKLPQRTLVQTAAAGYSSYGNQIGLTTGLVDEIYHPGYVAKHMELGAVVGAAPAENVRREVPAAGDVVILLGGATGRDGIGGATGSSKAHDSHSVETCGAEVQKGNAPEERKLQRLFRNSEACKMIKRCNDFGAGGVSVAIGELADGLDINLNEVPKKYEGLDGTELAISESQERMAVVLAASDVERFSAIANEENLNVAIVAKVTKEPRLVMRWNGDKIVDIAREFLDTNGAPKTAECKAAKAELKNKEIKGTWTENYKALASNLNICSKRGLSERFDSSIGANTVLMPFGGKYQQTPIQAMVHKIAVEKKHTDDCSVMSWGYNPFITEESPYHGAFLAVVESVCKLVATGAKFEDVYLSFQEYFEKLGVDASRWGKPFSALLGAYKAQMQLGVAAIGGKDSMSGSFENIDVPPTLVSFAITTEKAANIISPEFKKAGSKLVLLSPEYDENGLPVIESLLKLFDVVNKLQRSGRALACYTPGMGGVAEAVLKMAIGNGYGFKFNASKLNDLFGYKYASFLIELDAAADANELAADITIPEGIKCIDGIDDIDAIEIIGEVTNDGCFTFEDESITLEELQGIYEDKLEDIYPCNIEDADTELEAFSYEAKSWSASSIKIAKPKVLIPVFPGTNCEYDAAKAMQDAGAEPEIMVIRNLDSSAIAESIERFAKSLKESQMVFIPGGFSGGDEPDGSAKYITCFFRNEAIKEGVTDLLDRRDGLMCGVCNGFQALIKLGLVPYGKIIDTDADCPTLTFNRIARHQSRIVQTRISSNKSPWLSMMKVGDIVSVPISHGEGRFYASDELVRQLAANGQIATQYVDLEGNVSADVHFNPNGSIHAIEGITSPDGRIFGKMGHSERRGNNLYKNVPGNYDIHMFESAVKYFK